MKHPPVTTSIPPHGPELSLRERLCGQFWIKLALLATDLPERPTLEPGSFRPRN
jgi:hypothetical protein